MEAKTVTQTETRTAIQTPAILPSVAARPTAEQPPGVTWKYLQTEYSDYLATDCDVESMDRDAYGTCLSLLDSGLDSLERDVIALPPSKARSDLLSAIERIAENYEQYSENRCYRNPMGEDCWVPATKMGIQFLVVNGIIDREASNE